MANFAANMTRTASASLSVGALTAAASNPRRFKLYDFVFGSAEAAPADGNSLWQIQRCTTAGTAGSSVTPIAVDPGDSVAATTVCGQAHSADPTLTANAILLSIGLNQRATFRWVPAPGKELLVPATASNGLAFRTPTAALVTCTAQTWFEEQ
jgi:hypothetical protein